MVTHAPVLKATPVKGHDEIRCCEAFPSSPLAGNGAAQTAVCMISETELHMTIPCKQRMQARAMMTLEPSAESTERLTAIVPLQRVWSVAAQQSVSGCTEACFPHRSDVMVVVHS